MAATLGHGRRDIIAAAAAQASRLSYVHNERLTNPRREQLAAELVEVAPTGMSRVRFVTGGAEANEMAIQMARSYHVERGDAKRWQVISPAQAYHGPTMATLGLTGRPGLQAPFGPYMSAHRHIPPSTWRFDPSGEAALAALDGVLEEVGPENVSAYFCEPISAAALPAYSPPELFWRGLAERRDKHGFLILYDEVVTGMGRTGHWFAADKLPLVPDIIATAKGLGAGYAAIGGVICQDHVYQAFANGSRKLTHGHTWDGAPVTCAVGLRAEKLEEAGRADLLRKTRAPLGLDSRLFFVGQLLLRDLLLLGALLLLGGLLFLLLLRLVLGLRLFLLGLFLFGLLRDHLHEAVGDLLDVGLAGPVDVPQVHHHQEVDQEGNARDGGEEPVHAAGHRAADGRRQLGPRLRRRRRDELEQNRHVAKDDLPA